MVLVPQQQPAARSRALREGSTYWRHELLHEVGKLIPTPIAIQFHRGELLASSNSARVPPHNCLCLSTWYCRHTCVYMRTRIQPFIAAVTVVLPAVGQHNPCVFTTDDR